MSSLLRRATRTSLSVRTRYGLGIERRLLLADGGLPSGRGWLGHEGILGTSTAAGEAVGTAPYAYPMQSGGLRGRRIPGAGALSGLGGGLTFLFGLLLALSALTGWYSGEGNGTTVSVIGWHTGTIGKIVLFLGLAAVLLVVLREVGVSMPASIPESLVTIGIGALATVLVLVRIISIPDDFFFASRGAGIWISLACSVGIILAGLLEASEEL